MYSPFILTTMSMNALISDRFVSASRRVMLTVVFAVCAFVPSLCAQEADSTLIEHLVNVRYQERLNHIRQRWMQLIPQIGDVQYAGNIGLVSVGIGWDYGHHDRWETHVMMSYLPQWHADSYDYTFTLKQNYIPWCVCSGRDFMINPVYGTIFMNSIFDREFWGREPEKYNGGHYYRFSSKIRTHIGIGGRISYYIPEQRRMLSRRASFYYELTTYDLAIISSIPNKKISLGDILCLGFGVQYKFF